MPWSVSRVRNLLVGDLVTHILYGKEWIGVVIEFVEKDEPDNRFFRRRALVQIQPGTKYDGFFSNNALSRDKVGDNLGYVSANWLFKIEEKKQ